MLTQAVNTLKSAQSIFVLTGAGISAESGIPTFRGANGLWKNYSVTDLATPQAFTRNPQLVWDWYRWRQDLISKAKPNAAHQAIVKLEQKFKNFLLLTQNIDNLHRRAGSQNVLELHGNIFRTRCLKCGDLLDDHTSHVLNKTLPKCRCGGLLRPDVVWFGETIPQDTWNQSLEFLNTADVALICGTSGVVFPAAAIPEIAKTSNTRTVEVNLEPTPLSSIVDIALHGKAGEILPELVAQVLSE